MYGDDDHTFEANTKIARRIKYTAPMMIVYVKWVKNNDIIFVSYYIW